MTTPRGNRANTPKDTPSTTDPAPDAPEVKAAPKAADVAAVEEVKYTGGAGVREITKAQWKKAGVEDQETVVWNSDNGYVLPGSDFNADALKVLERDPQIKTK